MATCPFCRQEDLHEEARRCPHCGTWLDEREDFHRKFEELRKEIRSELREDLGEHRVYLSSLFNRVQLAATIIIILVLGVFTYLGVRTDKGVRDITERMKGQIEARLASREAQDLIENAINLGIETRIKSEEARALLEKKTEQAVEKMVGKEAIGPMSRIAAIEVRMGDIENNLRQVRGGLLRTGSTETIAKILPKDDKLKDPDPSEDYEQLVSNVRNRLEQKGKGSEGALKDIKKEIQQTRTEKRSEKIDEVREEMDAYRRWLASIGFKKLPELPEIVVDSTYPTSAYYGSGAVYIGEQSPYPTRELAAMYFYYVADTLDVLRYRGSDQTFVLLQGFYVYFTSAYQNRAPTAMGSAPDGPLNPKYLQNLAYGTMDIWTASSGWALGCWDLRNEFGVHKVDLTLANVVQNIGPRPTVSDAILVVESELVAQLGEESRSRIRLAFKQQGAVITEATSQKEPEQKEGGKQLDPSIPSDDDELIVEDIANSRIPDNDPAGLIRILKIPSGRVIEEISVSIDADHTYIGDLQIVLTPPDGTAIRLYSRTGSNTDDLRRTWSTSDFLGLQALRGRDAGGSWTLKITDHSPMDIGKLNRWEIKVKS